MADSYDSIIQEIEKGEEIAKTRQEAERLYEKTASLDGVLVLLSLPFSVFGLLFTRLMSRAWARPRPAGWGVCAAVSLLCCGLSQEPWFFITLGASSVFALLYVLRDREWLNLGLIVGCIALGGGLLAVLQIEKEQPEGFYGGHIGDVSAIAISLDGRSLISGGSDRKVVLWDVATHQPVRTFAAHTRRVTSVAIFPKGDRALSASWDRNIVVYDLSKGTIAWRVEKPDGVSGAVVPPGGDRIVVGHESGKISVYDDSGKEQARLDAHGERVTSLAVSPDGERFVSTGLDDQIKVWSLVEQRLLESREWKGSAPVKAAFSPDKRTALTGDQGGKIALWDTSTWRIRMSIEIQGGITDACFSPDGKRILVGTGAPGTVSILNAETGAVVQTVSDPQFGVNALAVSLDKRFFFAAFGGTIRQFRFPEE